MSRHWSDYAGKELSERQIRAMDAMAREHGLSDGLDVLATASGLSRSKATKLTNHPYRYRTLVDEAFERYGRSQ